MRESGSIGVGYQLLDQRKGITGAAPAYQPLDQAGRLAGLQQA
jgi:hypothetical protein